MIIVFLALLMGLGVLFGSQAMVVDLGYSMGQQGAMQNGADAGAMAAARLLASSVGNASPINYVASDNQVHNIAAQFASYNRPGAMTTATFQIAVEYLIWNGVQPNPCVSASPRIFTRNSNSGLVSEMSGGYNPAPPDQLGSVPAGTCGVRVVARETHEALFAQVSGHDVMRPTASATARILPAPAPTVLTRVWPVTRWLGAPGCTFTLNSAPCSFWDSHGPPNGNFKLLVDLSRYSSIRSPQAAQLIVDYDHDHPGNSAQRQTDLDLWFRYGWHGQLSVADSRCANTTPSPLPFANCSNSRLEIYNGTLGNNVGGAMQYFIANNAEGVDASGRNLGRYVTMQVFLWRYGESGMNITTGVASTLWTNGSSSSIQRVILDQMRCFRFYETTVSNSNADGYYVSCLSSDPGGNGPPSNVANTVGLIG
jgi:hypothetical protein